MKGKFGRKRKSKWGLRLSPRIAGEGSGWVGGGYQPWATGRPCEGRIARDEDDSQLASDRFAFTSFRQLGQLWYRERMIRKKLRLEIRIFYGIICDQLFAKDIGFTWICQFDQFLLDRFFLKSCLTMRFFFCSNSMIWILDTTKFIEVQSVLGGIMAHS